jgi:alkanesulfonate monooxygenase SsuD/methylene tetrahydromethanopterin reductase-like flavin-dependent oxidoreductase (luciferase family)
VAVNILPVHHPLHVAEQAAMLDVLSHGRLEFAFGRGHVHSRVYEGFGADREDSRARQEETLQVILAAWTQDLLTFHGRYYDIPGVVVNPRPLQRPHPPIYAATSSLDGAEDAARQGLNLFLPAHLFPRSELCRYAAAYWDGLRQHGHDPARRELGLLFPIHVAETTTRAQAEARDGFLDYYRVITEIRADYADWRTRQGLDVAAMSPREVMTFERLCAEAAVLADPPAAEGALRQLAEQTGATQILCWMNMGSIPHAAVLRSMELFSRAVLPRLAGSLGN